MLYDICGHVIYSRYLFLPTDTNFKLSASETCLLIRLNIHREAPLRRVKIIIVFTVIPIGVQVWK